MAPRQVKEQPEIQDALSKIKQIEIERSIGPEVLVHTFSPSIPEAGASLKPALSVSAQK